MTLGKRKFSVFCGHDLCKCLNAIKHAKYEKLISKIVFYISLIWKNRIFFQIYQQIENRSHYHLNMN